MKITLFCVLLLTTTLAAASDFKKGNRASGCEEMDQPTTQTEFKMCKDAQEKMILAIKKSQSKGCAGMRSPEFMEEYKTCMKLRRVPASNK